MESSISKEKYLRDLNQLIEKLTHSGDKNLNAANLSNLIHIWRLDKSYVEHSIPLLFKYLQEKHSEVRFSCVQVINELFVGFECSRRDLERRLNLLLEYGFGGARAKDHTLPPPLKVASDLRKLTLSTIKAWHDKFGSAPSCSPRLKLTIQYLQLRENVDFDILEVVDPKERKRQQEEEKIQLKLNKERLERSKREIDELIVEIESSVASLDTCLSLLVPDFLEFDSGNQPPQVHNESEEATSDLRLFGFLNPNQKLELELNVAPKVEIVENEENSAIIENAQDLYKLMSNRLLPKIDAWIQLIIKAQGSVDLRQRAEDQKRKIKGVLLKYNKLELIKKKEKIRDKGEDSPFLEEDGDEEVSTDSELEEVREPLRRKRKKSTNEDESFLDPAYSKKRLKDLKQPAESKEVEVEEEEVKEGNSEERKKKLLSIAPKLPFDIDLYHWEDEKLPTPTLIPVNPCAGESFWCSSSDGPSADGLAVPGGSSSLRSRVIEFTGEFEKVERACRAPLPSGNLCPRHDRVKCPLHGLIVPRDDKGNILNPEDEGKVKKITVVPDWQDPKLLAEIKASTGVDLKMPEKGRKGKKRRKYPGLTDLKEKFNTPFTRIAKKVFNKASLKRVASVLDRLDSKKFTDKFGDQFNYVYK